MTRVQRRTYIVDLPDDVLIHIFNFLTIRGILSTRQTSKRLLTVSKFLAVWQQACLTYVISQGIPFPSGDLSEQDSHQLERLTRHAYLIGQFWLSRSRFPRQMLHFSASSGTAVSEVRFIPGKPDWLITVSKGIWSMIACWSISVAGSAIKLAEWSAQGAIISGITVNSDRTSQAVLAVSTNYSDYRRLHIFTIHASGPKGSTQFECLATIDTSFNAMRLCGDLLAISDDINETRIVNWRTGSLAVLWGSHETSEHNFQHNRCLKVVFSSGAVFVVRARSFEAFLSPSLFPPDEVSRPEYAVARHYFGWIDGVAVSSSGPAHGFSNFDNTTPLSIVLRTESDDPWSSNMHTLDLYHLQKAIFPEYDDELSEHEVRRYELGYLFPPSHIGSWPSTRGHLRCTDIALGDHGTALWVQPRPSRHTDLTGFDVHNSDAQGSGYHPVTGSRISRRETLVATVLPGILRDCHDELEDSTRTLWTLDDSSSTWTALDYDEARGLIALGDSQGKVAILELVKSTTL